MPNAAVLMTVGHILLVFVVVLSLSFAFVLLSNTLIDYYIVYTCSVVLLIWAVPIALRYVSS